MKYEDEHSVRIYPRKTGTWHLMGFEGRSTYWHIKGAANLMGRIEVGDGDEWTDIAERVGVPAAVFDREVARLFELDMLRWECEDGSIKQSRPGREDLARAERGSLIVVDYEESERVRFSSRVYDKRFRSLRELRKKARELRRIRDGLAKAPKPKERISVEQAKEMGLLTRTEAAFALGVSLATLRRREGLPEKEGGLPVLLTDRGEHMFKPEDVSRIQKLALKTPVATRAPREKPIEDGNSPIWRERAARLAEELGDRSLTLSELRGVAKRIGMREAVLEEVLVEADGKELEKVDGRFRVRKEGAE